MKLAGKVAIVTGTSPNIGAGIAGGKVYGKSNRLGEYPTSKPVRPEELAATIYHCLGIDPRAHISDQQGRPLVVGTGTPIQALLASGGT